MDFRPSRNKIQRHHSAGQVVPAATGCSVSAGAPAAAPAKPIGSTEKPGTSTMKNLLRPTLRFGRLNTMPSYRFFSISE